MKNCLYFVYREADGCDCTGDGLSSKVNQGIMFWDCTQEEAIEYCKENMINPDYQFYLVNRMLWGEDHSYAIPLTGHENGMFGGNFIFTSNGVSYKFLGERTSRPIQVHDRYEY